MLLAYSILTSLQPVNIKPFNFIRIKIYYNIKIAICAIICNNYFFFPINSAPITETIYPNDFYLIFRNRGNHLEAIFL